MDGKGRHEVGGQHSDAAERMQHAIRAVASGTGSKAELHAAARALVTQLRLERAPPEQMLLRIKAILAQNGIQPTCESDIGACGVETAMYRDVIASSIRFYYEAEEDG